MLPSALLSLILNCIRDFAEIADTAVNWFMVHISETGCPLFPQSFHKLFRTILPYVQRFHPHSYSLFSESSESLVFPLQWQYIVLFCLPGRLKQVYSFFKWLFREWMGHKQVRIMSCDIYLIIFIKTRVYPKVFYPFKVWSVLFKPALIQWTLRKKSSTSACIGIFACCDVISWGIFKCFTSLGSIQPRLKGCISQWTIIMGVLKLCHE